MQQLIITKSEVDEIEKILFQVAAAYDDPNADDFLSVCTLYSHELPRRIRSEVNRFRLDEPKHGLLVLSGFPIDNNSIGPTPTAFRTGSEPSRTFREEAFLLLVMGLLGDAVGWSTQQSGRMIHDVFPIPEHEEMQLGTGCKQTLTWHTEDAFHPFRSDYLGMLCLRNPERVPTTVASVADLDLDARTVDALFDENYIILPDHSHRGTTDIEPGAGRDQIDAMLQTPQNVAVFFGDRDDPYVRIDPYFMPMPEQEAARSAFQNVVEQFDANLQDLVLSPGDLCVMDNFRLVHGRRAFRATYDGSDRWLKRALVARDLRKSKSARIQSRVIQ